MGMKQSTMTASGGGAKRALRRLPHVYKKGTTALHFFAACVPMGEVRACLVRIYPGVVKVVVVHAGTGDDEDGDDMELDRWRYQLPEDCCPELAMAGYGRGEGGDGARRCCNGAAGEIGGKLVAVQLNQWGTSERV
ncbi:hypothetical protein VPH35_074409 [Triticum aestivum]